MNEKEKEVGQIYKSYKKRWLVLCVVVMLNLSGAMIWITFTPVAYRAAVYYDTDLGTINWLSLVFLLSGICLGPLATWVLEIYGLKVALLISSWLTVVGGALRIASAADTLPYIGQIALLFTGQTLTAVGQPFSMYAPAKTASIWFPENQRALANTCGAVANPIGVVIAGLIAPLFVDRDTDLLDTLTLLITMACPAAFTAILATFVMTSGEPPLPPSAGAAKKEALFGSGIKEVMRNKNFLVLLFTIGGAIGLYSTFATLLEQFLCPFGYTDTMAGICAAVLTACGVVGAAMVGIYCDYSKQFSTAVKCSYFITSVGIIVFSCVFHINMGYLILILVGAIGLFSFGIYPIGVELGAENTYPVGVATSSGLIMISGQLQSIILVLILQVIGRKMSPDEVEKYGSKCHPVTDDVTTVSYHATTAVPEAPPSTYDMSVSVYVCAGYFTLLGIILIAFFRPNYKRMAAEKPEDDDVTATHVSVLENYTHNNNNDYTNL